MAKYDFDSYTLYDLKRRDVYSVKIRVILKEQVDGAVLSEAAAKAFRRFPYYSRTVAVNEEGAYVFEPCDQPIAVIEGDKSVRLGTLNFTMDSFVPRMDYMERMKDPNGIDGYYPIRLPKAPLMKYAHDNDGSPNSILAAVLYKMCVKALPEESKFTVGIANNYREDVGCPDTYRDILREMYVQYDSRMKDWPVDKISTVTRSRMYIQMQPELSWERCRRVEEPRRQIDAQPDLESKADYAFENSLPTHGVPSAFHISYVGKVDWGGLEPFIDGVYSLTIAHLMIEVNANEEYFFVSFHTVRKDGKYIKKFLQVLDEEGIAYSVGELMERRLPKTILP